MPHAFCTACGTSIVSCRFCPECGTPCNATPSAPPLPEQQFSSDGLAEAKTEAKTEADEDEELARVLRLSSEECKADAKREDVVQYDLNSEERKNMADEMDDDLAKAIAESKRSYQYSKSPSRDLEFAIAESKRSASTGSSLTEDPADCPTTINYIDGPADVTICNARPQTADGALTLDTHGFTLMPHTTSVKTSDFYDTSKEGKYMREQVYYSEITSLLETVTHADKVFILADQVRNDQKKDTSKANAFAGGQVSGYAGVVHTDYCGTNAVKKFHRSVGIPPGVKVRYTLINTWRNIAAEPIHNNTLACVDSTSVSPDDFVRFDEPLKYGAVCRDKNGNSLGSCAEQYRLKKRNAGSHRWYHYPKMTRNEILLFAQFDSDPEHVSRFCFHTAFNDRRVPATAPARESMECRAMCIFLEADPSWGVLNAPMIKMNLVDNIKLEKEAQITLQERLAVGAGKGFIKRDEVEKIAEHAALQRIDTGDLLEMLCEERGLDYNEDDWLKDNEEEKRERTFERMILVDKGDSRALVFSHAAGLAKGDVVSLMLRSHRGKGLGRMYIDERRHGPWRYIESGVGTEGDKASLVDGKFIKLEDANLVLDVTNWKMEAGSRVNWVGGTTKKQCTKLGGGGRDWAVNGDGTISCKHRMDLVLGAKGGEARRGGGKGRREDVGSYSVKHRHWNGAELTSGAHTHGGGVVLLEDGTFVAHVTPCGDQTGSGTWTGGGAGGLTLKWTGGSGLETRFKDLRGTTWMEGRERKETAGAFNLQRM